MGFFETLFGPKCPGCDKPLTRPIICVECEAELVPWHVPGFVYLGNYQRFGRLSRAIKYGGQRQLASFLAKKIALDVRQAEWKLQGITAVPTLLHCQVQRGYNQAELLAQGVAKELKLPYRAVLKRVVYTKSQTQKTLRERLDLPEETFQAEKVPGVWLLIDDVVTTGTTFKRAKHVLLEVGATKSVFMKGGEIAVRLKL